MCAFVLLAVQFCKTLISQTKYEKSIGCFFARDEAIWIQTFKSLASKLGEFFGVKDVD